LGAGGASHAISTKLALEGVNKIIILNRTLSKGKKLASEIHEKFDNVKLECDTLDNFYKYLDIDMIVNCTTIGMYPDIDSSPVDLSMFNNDIIVYDIVYKPIKTKLLHMAERMGMETIEGIDMLINQGLLSQKIWFNYEIDNLFKDVDELKKLLI
ncbi:shikimate dehydrogenase, partial [Anaerosalibacter bizertensis]|nr:shikimate dehydrogenase [Anaerosalibacter bizertensis]